MMLRGTPLDRLHGKPWGLTPSLCSNRRIVLLFSLLPKERKPQMRKSLVSLCATALAALLVTGAAARADSIPWGYTSASTEIFNTNNPIKTSSISFNGSTAGATGDSGIIIYNLESHSSAEIGSPDSF